ncbi:MAG: PDZ domain-containing protein [Acidobacteria bacterium]|nr:PDZ domain-containing protein [Acidobacteriota bacterium]
MLRDCHKKVGCSARSSRRGIITAWPLCAVFLLFAAVPARAQEGSAPTAPPQPGEIQDRQPATTAKRRPVAAPHIKPVPPSPTAAATPSARAPQAAPAKPLPPGLLATPTAPASPVAPPPPPRQVVTVVHRLCGWKLLTWLALTSPPSLEIDKFPTIADVHTNIVAGLVSEDGRTVVARLPQAEVELESMPEPQFPRGLFPEESKEELPDFMLVRADGTRVAAKFIGLDASTGLSLLEAAEPLLSSRGDEGDTETPTVGQRVRLFAPAQAPLAATRAQSGLAGDEGVIYLSMEQTEGLLTEVKRAPSGKAMQATAHASLISPAWTGAVATNSSGAPVGIVAQSGVGGTKIVPLEVMHGAATRVLARRASVPQPWLGARGDAATTFPISFWLNKGWKPELLLPLLQDKQGVLLTSVAPGTPAALAGLRPGDLVTRLGGREVRGIEDLSLLLRESSVGASIDFTIWRAKGTSPLNVPVVLSGTQNPALATAEAEARGLRAELRDARAVVRRSVAKGPEGVQVTAPPAPSEARRASTGAHHGRSDRVSDDAADGRYVGESMATPRPRSDRPDAPQRRPFRRKKRRAGLDRAPRKPRREERPACRRHD